MNLIEVSHLTKYYGKAQHSLAGGSLPSNRMNWTSQFLAALWTCRLR